jgi:hypothetical protein
MDMYPAGGSLERACFIYFVVIGTKEIKQGRCSKAKAEEYFHHYPYEYVGHGSLRGRDLNMNVEATPQMATHRREHHSLPRLK